MKKKIFGLNYLTDDEAVNVQGRAVCPDGQYMTRDTSTGGGAEQYDWDCNSSSSGKRVKTWTPAW